MIEQRLEQLIHRMRGQARGAMIAAILAIGVVILGSAMLVSAQTVTGTPTTPESCPPATPVSGQTAPKDCVVIGQYDIYFKPNLITIPADTPVRLVFENHGATIHNFSITDHENSGLKNLDISVTVDPGKTGETTINAPEGVYYFFCNQPGHEAAGMRGYLTVKKDATIATEYAETVPERSS
jgi:uncharacterized cupredoxin-like copper-binding protein